MGMGLSVARDGEGGEMWRIRERLDGACLGVGKQGGG